MTLSSISEQVWDGKYRLKDASGAPLDGTIEDSWRRVARALAAVERRPADWEGRFYAALEGFRFLPAGRILAVLVAENGGVVERIIEDDAPISPRELERVRDHLAERIDGRTLVGLRQLLEAEQAGLRGEADAILRRAWRLGLRACEASDAEASEDLVIATRLALLDQPEFTDPERIRGLFAALETNERLLALLQQIAEADGGERRVGLAMSLGAELGEPALRDCALLAIPYGRAEVRSDGRHEGRLDRSFEETASKSEAPLGMLGVIGPQRMDYSRVIPLVGYFSDAVTRKLLA